MKQNRLVQFVYFETILPQEQFIAQWELFTKSVNSNLDVTIQQCEKNGLFSYIAQHHCSQDQFQFVFEKGRRSPKNREEPIKTTQAGGYSFLQNERTDHLRGNESKVFAFVTNPNDDLEIYRTMSTQGELNIYEPYYENCRYAYILEFFVKSQYTTELLHQLKSHHVAEAGIYKECVRGCNNGIEKRALAGHFTR